MENEYTFETAIRAYKEGAEIKSCFSGTKYKLEDSRHMRMKCFQLEFEPSGSIPINEITNTWFIRR